MYTSSPLWHSFHIDPQPTAWATSRHIASRTSRISLAASCASSNWKVTEARHPLTLLWISCSSLSSHSGSLPAWLPPITRSRRQPRIMIAFTRRQERRSWLSPSASLCHCRGEWKPISSVGGRPCLEYGWAGLARRPSSPREPCNSCHPLPSPVPTHRSRLDGRWQMKTTGWFLAAKEAREIYPFKTYKQGREVLRILRNFWESLLREGRGKNCPF